MRKQEGQAVVSVRRYNVEKLNCCFDADMIESPTGEYVEYADYAALLATNERVCQRFAKTQCEANEAEAEAERLKAEVETIRKDRDLLLASHKVALADIQRLHWELQTAKEGKNT